jgi:hypothetical protein
MDFLRWQARSEADGFPTDWNPLQLARVEHLLQPMAAAFHAAKGQRLNMLKQQR